MFGSSLVVAVLATTLQSPTTSLTRRTGAAAEPFSNVAGVQELPDGRVVVADVRDRTLSVVDFDHGGQVRPLGRNGSGPNEYTSAQHLLRGRSDTLLLLDFPARRLLRIAPNATLAGTIPIDLTVADTLPGEKPEPDRLVTGPRAIDAAGGLYYEVGYMEVGKGVRPERLVARWDPSTRTSRIAATVRAWYPDRSTRWRAPFLYQDIWTVAPDGRVARVVPTDYHVEWFRDGKLIARGAPTSVEPVRVTKADRDAWYRARASAASGSASMAARDPTTGASGSPSVRAPRPPGFTDADFPNVKPPFVEEISGRSATVGTDGELWVSRTFAAGATTAMADVFDGSGRLVRHVTFPTTHRVAGLGKGTVYLVRTDDDGLQWLERYAR